MPSGPSWQRIAAGRYGFGRATLIEERVHYSRHFFISVDNVRYVLSQVRRSCDKPPFQMQFHIIDLLRDAGTDMVRPPVPTTAGRPYAAERNCFWFLRSFRRTDTVFWRSSPELVAHAAHMLADIHELGALARPDVAALSGLRHDGFAPYYRTVETFLNNVDATYHDFDDSALTAADCELLDRTLAYLMAHRADVLAASRDAGLIGITHHDYRPDNLLVRDGRIAEIIDWDCAFVDHQLYDVGFAALQFGQRQRLRDSRLGHARLFVDAYFRRRGITDLPSGVAAWFLRFVVVKRLLINGSNSERVRLLHALESDEPVTRPAAALH